MTRDLPFSPGREKSATLGARATSGALLTGAAQGIKLAVQIASAVVLSRLLEPKDFGAVAMVWPVVAFIGLFQDFGLNQATVQKPDLTHGEASLLFWINVGLSVLLAFGLVAAAPVVSAFFRAPELSDLVIAYAGLFAVNSLGAQHGALLTRSMRFGALALADGGSVVVGFLVTALVAVVWPSYWAFFIGSAGSALFGLAVMWRSHPWTPSLPRPERSLRSMLGFGAGLTGFNIVNFLARNLDNILIGRAFGDSVLGYYDRAYKLLLFPLQQINFPLARVLLPMLARLQSDAPRYRSAYLRTLRLALISTLPGVAFSIVHAGSVIPLLLGEQWREAVEIFAWLGFASLVQPLNNLSGALYVSQGRTQEFAAYGFILSAIPILSFFLGLPFGVTGVAAAYAIAEVAKTPLVWWAATRKGPVSLRDIVETVTPNVAATAASFAALLALRAVSLDSLLSCALGAVLSYLATVAVLACFPGGRAAMRDLVEIATRHMIEPLRAALTRLRARRAATTADLDRS
jgi:PST family polysaccharide transporter